MGLEFQVTLERPFGLTFPLTDSQVRRIEKGKNADLYNESAPKYKIQPGDILLSISYNGQYINTKGWGASQIAQYLARCVGPIQLSFERGTLPVVTIAAAPVKQATLPKVAGLPTGWARYHDPKTGKFFYQNSVTQQVQWTVPTATSVTPSPQPTLPSEWVAHMDPRTKMPFYQNIKTKEVRWTLPGETMEQATANSEVWTQHYDAKTANSFYQSSVTKAVVWTLPKGSKVVPSSIPAPTAALCPIILQGRPCPIVDTAHRQEFKHETSEAETSGPEAPNTQPAPPPGLLSVLAPLDKSNLPARASLSTAVQSTTNFPPASAGFVLPQASVPTRGVVSSLMSSPPPAGQTDGKKKTPKSGRKKSRTPRRSPKSGKKSKSPKSGKKAASEIKAAMQPSEEDVQRLQQEADAIQSKSLGAELVKTLPQPQDLPVGWVMLETIDKSQTFVFCEARQTARDHVFAEEQLRLAKEAARKAKQAELEVDLVPGWVVTVNEDDSVTYYNSDTKESSWQRPKPKPKPLPPSWSAAIDPQTGKEYYYHMVTQEISYTRPELNDTPQSSIDTSSKYGTLTPSKIANKWMETQSKSFLRWVNFTLKPKKIVVQDLFKDLKDGVVLFQLLSQVAGKAVGTCNARPKLRIHRLENINFCLKFLETNGIKLINIQDTDIEEGKPKIILGLIWTIILHYQILKVKQQEAAKAAIKALEDAKQAEKDENIPPQELISDLTLIDSLERSKREMEDTPEADARNPKDLLLMWVNSQIAGYDTGVGTVKNFTSHWKDGKVLTALTDSLRPGAFPLSDMTGDAQQDCARAISKAEEEFGLPPLLDASDISDYSGDVLALMTYVSYFKDVWTEAQDTKSGRVIDPAYAKVRINKGQLLEVGTEVKFNIQCYTSNGLPIDAQQVVPTFLKDGELKWLVTLTAPNNEQIHLENPVRVATASEMNIDTAQNGESKQSTDMDDDSLNALQFEGSFEATVEGIHYLAVSLQYMRLGVEVTKSISNSGLAVPIDNQGTHAKHQSEEKAEQERVKTEEKKKAEKIEKEIEEREAEEEAKREEEEEAKMEEEAKKGGIMGKKWHELAEEKRRRKQQATNQRKQALPTRGDDGAFRIGGLQVEFPPGAAASLSLGIIKIKVFFDLKKRLVVKVCEARGLPGYNSYGSCDPYVKIYLMPDEAKRTKKKTQLLRKKVNPVWNETFFYAAELLEPYLASPGATLQISVWHYNFGGNNEFVGHILLDISRVPMLQGAESSLTSEKGLDRWLAIQPRHMFKLGSCSVMQENCIKYPDGSFRLPDGVYLLPDGSILDKQKQTSNKVPKGGLLLPDGSVLRNDATCRLPSGAILRLDGNLRLPDGSITQPKWACLSAELPFGVVQHSDFHFECDGVLVTEPPLADTCVALGVMKLAMSYDSTREELTVQLFEARGLLGGVNPYVVLELKGVGQKRVNSRRGSTISRESKRRSSTLTKGELANNEDPDNATKTQFSRVYKDNIDPTFDQHFKFPLEKKYLAQEELLVQFKNFKRMAVDEHVGQVRIPALHEFTKNGGLPAWFSIQPALI
eukprot:gb/GEZN01000294.1/.p1 GENE.gb/GEZN01000294.1/~~gb/GEZN01000294.1/.p1  ORF type:complete len:1551 (+),score=300.96 gb/GEZN01000294.1/:372-5024(+)